MNPMRVGPGEVSDGDHDAVVRILIASCATLKSFTKEWLRLCRYARWVNRMRRTNLGDLNVLLDPEKCLLWRV